MHLVGLVCVAIIGAALVMAKRQGWLTRAAAHDHASLDGLEWDENGSASSDSDRMHQLQDESEI